MLRVLILLTALLLATPSFAQEYSDSIPAFLRNSPAPQQNQKEPPKSIPAFLQMEMQRGGEPRQQNAPAPQERQPWQQPLVPATLPPADYKPAPGAVPTFIQKEQSPEPTTEKESKPVIKTNQKEDTIQINFTEEEYNNKNEEVQPAKKEELPEGSEDVIKLPTESETQQEAAPVEKAADPVEEATPEAEKKEEITIQSQPAEEQVAEPEKASNNIVRIIFDKEETNLSEKSRELIILAAKQLKDSKDRFVIKSYTSDMGSADKENLLSIQRLTQLRQHLKSLEIDFLQFEVKIVNSAENKDGINYIDIDKI